MYFSKQDCNDREIIVLMLVAVVRPVSLDDPLTVMPAWIVVICNKLGINSMFGHSLGRSQRKDPPNVSHTFLGRCFAAISVPHCIAIGICYLSILLDAPVVATVASRLSRWSRSYRRRCYGSLRRF